MVSDDPWKKLVEEPEFNDSIEKFGYYSSPLSFQPFIKKYNLSLRNRAPSYLSIDFWSGQPKTLTERRCYVIRTGKGKFVIFNENRFAKPYLDLNLAETKNQIPVRQIVGYQVLRNAFKQHYHEDTNLEQLRLLGVYDEVVARLFGAKEYHIGPRGHRNSKFQLYFIDKDSDSRAQFTYDGQEELDYSIWTEDSVLVFEAKQFQTRTGIPGSVSRNLGTDIGWHKLAYPCFRFHEYSELNVYPVYYLRIDTTIYLFVFSKIEFESDGMVLNRVADFKPNRAFRIGLV